MREKKKHRNKKFMILGVLVFILVLGVSYAWLTFQVEGEREFNLTPQDLDIEIIEKSKDLTLSSSMPVPDKVGMQGEPFEFSIQNNSKVDVQYTLKLVDDEEKKNSCSKCKFIPSQDINYELVRKSLNKVDTLTEGREIDTGILKRGEKNKIDYTLKIWLKEDASNASNGGVFYGKIKMEAVQILGTSDYAKPVEDGSGANVPELGNRLIPVVYNETSENWEKANISKKGEWYDYTKQKWANAVIVEPSEYDSTYKNAKAGITIPMDDILQMYVWIPRYSYTIQGDYGKNGSNASNPGEIEVKFVTTETKEEGTAKYTTDTPSDTDWYTPDAFTLGNKELSGIWVGKFESGYKNAVDAIGAQKNVNEPQNVIIKPNVYSWRNISVSNIYSTVKGIAGNAAFGISETIYDSHAMKNSEWGAVAYLTQSQYGKYGNSAYEGANKEVYINNYSTDGGYKTGCSGERPGASMSNTCTSYNNLESAGDGAGQKGPGASTTGTIYGVYDMTGGTWEYVMGNYSHTMGSSGFTGDWDTQYKDYINFYTTSTAKSHALSETASWYGEYQSLVGSTYPWMIRGGGYNDTTNAGVFSYHNNTGGSDRGLSFRVVLTLN